MLTTSLELDIRNQVNKQLENLGWILDRKNNPNVFVEQPRSQEEKIKLGGRRPDYVLYSKDENIESPLIVIETKKPGVNLNDALIQGSWYANQLNSPMVFATDGIYYKTLHTKFQKPLILNGEEVSELLRELEAIKFLNTNEIDTISKEVKYSREELIKIFAESNEILRDEGLRAGIERFSEFANILFLKLLGEIESIKEEQGQEFVLTQDLRWDSWKNKSGNELLNYVNDVVLKKMGEKYGDENIFSDLSIKNPSVLKKIINKLDPLNLVNIDSDIKGDSFEYFLRQSTATKNDLGEYFTPRHIVKMMVKLANPQIGEKIYDPFCGTGGLLIESFKHIYNSMKRTPENLDRLRKSTVYGNEITNTARITKMNMILAGDGHSNVQMINSLKNPVDEKYDIVITNMPYSQKTDYGSLYDLQTNNGDSVCIQHCIRAVDKLSEDGRMVLIVPEGFLFRKDMYRTREYLLDRCTIQSIISLPQGVFLPYTGVKTNILYCTNVKKHISQDKIWYFEVKNDGYSLDSNRKKLEGEDDLKKFLEFRNVEKQDEQDILRVGFTEIKMDDIRSNNLILSGNRYKNLFNTKNINWKMVELGDDAYFDIIAGGTPDSQEKSYWDGDIDWATLVDLPSENFVTEIYYTKRKITRDGLEKSAAKLLPINSVLVSTRATIGRVAIARTKLATNQGFKNIVIKDFNLVNEVYLAYVLTKLRNQMESLASGGTFKEISKSSFMKLQIPLPPLDIQKQIAEELNSYQEIINGSKQVIKYYTSIIKIDPNWKTEKIGDLCTLKTGGTPSTQHPEYYGGEIKWLVSGDINKGEIFDCDHRITDAGLKNSNANILPKDSVLIALNGQGKTRGSVAFLHTEAACNQSLIAMIVKNTKKLMPEFLYYCLKNRYSEIREMTGDNERSGLNMSLVKNIIVPVPDINIQKQILLDLTKERSLIETNKIIVEIFEQKINSTLEEIWKY